MSHYGTNSFDFIRALPSLPLLAVCLTLCCGILIHSAWFHHWKHCEGGKKWPVTRIVTDGSTLGLILMLICFIIGKSDAALSWSKASQSVLLNVFGIALGAVWALLGDLVRCLSSVCVIKRVCIVYGGWCVPARCVCVRVCACACALVRVRGA
jgi:hypothetical protein